MSEAKDKKALNPKDDKKNLKKDSKKAKFNLAQKWSEIVAELKKVTWPSRKDLIRHSIVVMVFVIVITAVIALYDLALSSLIKLVI